MQWWKLAIGAVRGVLVWAPPDEARRMPEAPAVQSAEVELTDEGGRKPNPRIKPLVLPAAQARHQAAAEAPTPLEEANLARSATRSRGEKTTVWPT